MRRPIITSLLCWAEAGDTTYRLHLTPEARDKALYHVEVERNGARIGWHPYNTETRGRQQFERTVEASHA